VLAGNDQYPVEAFRPASSMQGYEGCDSAGGVSCPSGTRSPMTHHGVHASTRARSRPIIVPIPATGRDHWIELLGPRGLFSSKGGGRILAFFRTTDGCVHGGKA